MVSDSIEFRFVAQAPFPSEVDPSLASGIVKQMLDAGAFPGSADGFASANIDAGRRDALTFLHDHGVVGLAGDAWRLTHSGLGCLVATFKLVNNRPFFIQR